MTTSGNNMIIKVGKGSITFVDKAKDFIEVQGADGSVKLVSLYNNIISNSVKNTIVNGTSDKDIIYNNAANVIVNAAEGNDKIIITGDNSVLNGDAGDDVIDNYGDTVKVDGGKGNDNIYNNGVGATINGGKGNDTVSNTGSSVKIDGGAGKDVFLYASDDGKDVITDYTAGKDKIKITSGSISKTTYSGKDVIFTIDKGTLTVKNGKGKKITVNNVTKLYSGSSALFAENNFVTTNNLSDIVAKKSVGEMDFSTSEKISQENLITYAQ